MAESVDSIHIISDHLHLIDYNNNYTIDDNYSSTEHFSSTRQLLEITNNNTSSDADGNHNDTNNNNNNNNNNLQTFHTLDHHDNNNLIISDVHNTHLSNNDHQHVDEVNMDERSSIKLRDSNNNNKNIKIKINKPPTDEEDNKKEMQGWWRNFNNNRMMNKNVPWSYSNIYIFLVLWNFTMITLYANSNYLLFIPSGVKIIISLFHVSAIILYLYDFVSFLFRRKGINSPIHV